MRISYCHGHGSEGLDLRVFSALDMEKLGNTYPRLLAKLFPQLHDCEEVANRQLITCTLKAIKLA